MRIGDSNMKIKVKSQAFDVIVRWIHLVALAVGVGGVGFVVLVLFPSMPVLPAEQQGAMGGAVFGRFGPIAWTVMATLTITGLLLITNRRPLSMTTTYAKVLIAKLVLVAVWAGTNAGVLLGWIPAPSGLQFSFYLGVVIIIFGASLAVLLRRAVAEG